LQTLPVLLDADALLGEAVRLRPPHGALLHQAPVADYEGDRHEEACDADPRLLVGPGRGDDDPAADDGPDEPDGDRQPRGHGIRAWNGEAGERAGDERREQSSDDVAEHQVRLPCPYEHLGPGRAVRPIGAHQAASH
jgi:hypothetical protein